MTGYQGMALTDSLRQFTGKRLQESHVRGDLVAVVRLASGHFLHSFGSDFLHGLHNKRPLTAWYAEHENRPSGIAVEWKPLGALGFSMRFRVLYRMSCGVV